MKFVTSLAFSDPTQLCELARAAEEAGWDGLVVSDHVVHPEKIATPYPYTKDGLPRWQAPTPWPDPWVAIGAMAAVTRRVRFFTGIYVLPMRNPFNVAKAVGTAAVLSGDRVTLGVGVGWMREEFQLLEQPFEQRGPRTDEMIEVLRKLWTQPLVTHKGAHHVIDNAGINPLPIRRPIPVWFGGAAEPVLRRAARIGDGWMPAGRPPDDRMKGYVDQLNGYLAAAGRDRTQFGIDPWISIQGLDKDEWRRRVEAWRGLGASHLAVDTMRAGFATPRAHIDAIRSFREVLS